MNKTYLYLYDINEAEQYAIFSLVGYNLDSYKKQFSYLDKRIIKINDKDVLSLFRKDLFNSTKPYYIKYDNKWYRWENYADDIGIMCFNKLYTDRKKKIRELKIKRLLDE
jgi:hypothetical protein